MTYSEHLLKARMERAKELLAGSNAIVKSVCYEVGYRDVKYFSRLFRQYTGVNPSIYQKCIVFSSCLTGLAALAAGLLRLFFIAAVTAAFAIRIAVWNIDKRGPNL